MLQITRQGKLWHKQRHSYIIYQITSYNHVLREQKKKFTMKYI